jgi:hypothetical protein
MAEPASRPPALDEEAPSLDPAAIERAYRRERTRRHVRSTRREFARSSNARFYVALAVLLFLTVVIALSALRVIQQTFGI